MNLLVIAEMLGKTLDEIQDITVDEYNTWRAYLKLKAQEAKRQSRRGGTPRARR